MVRSVRMLGVMGVRGVLAVLGLAAGCGGSADRADVRPVVGEDVNVTTTTTVVETSTTTFAEPTTTGLTTTGLTTTGPAADPVRAEVETAYRNASQAFTDAASIPDPAFPGLAKWTTGAIFERWTSDVTAMRIQGRRVRMPENSVFEIRVERFEQVSPTLATLETCERDDGIVFEPATGVVINDDVSSQRKLATLEFVDGMWRLAGREDLGESEGEACFA